MTLLKKFKRLLVCLLAVVSFCVFSYTFPYWGNLPSAYTDNEFNINVDFEFSTNAFDMLPPNTPDYIITRLQELDSSNIDASKLTALIETIVSIVNYPSFNLQAFNVHIGASATDLFENGINGTINNGDYVLYVTQEGQVSLVHVNENSNFSINSLDSLLQALSAAWTGVNKISNVWLYGNLYNTFNAPVEYGTKSYLMNFDGPSGTPPPQDLNTWFELSADYEFNPLNHRYYTGYIVKHDGSYFVANSNAHGNIPTMVGWSPWTLIDPYSHENYYHADRIVYTIDGGVPRFWKALRPVSLIEPNEQSAQNGDWQEINNGWIGRNGDSLIKSYYFSHNTYKSGTTVINGVSPSLKYSYFTAVRDVPCNTPPLITNSAGEVVLNSEFWQVYS